MWNQCYRSLLAWFSAKVAKKNAQNHASTGPQNLHDQPLNRQCCKGKAGQI